jgi:hypothetical protein
MLVVTLRLNGGCKTMIMTSTLVHRGREEIGVRGLSPWLTAVALISLAETVKSVILLWEMRHHLPLRLLPRRSNGTTAMVNWVARMEVINAVVAESHSVIKTRTVMLRPR